MISAFFDKYIKGYKYFLFFLFD